ncbi:Asp-tRNA(Asn)/Glu-tRNA(Gln) amidotransferase subunit GatB [Candidatus Kaiserbacteria bacterium]|nr:Asp-tRNA(Asn)/Glu-tRNA(Gln) amidotransferase subunit GatB [Candidatus Kaiserbacteria bacterium]
MALLPTIGLEIHAELRTSTKMFCNCKNDPDEERPNVNICPICLAHPGTLPVINREAVRQVLRAGAALGGTLAHFSEFDRKSYFYPDIPKGYQISQYEHPLVTGGTLAGVAITRIHLEEDTARSTHGENKSLIDFNRAGIPLMELVTEPVIHDAKTAGDFARELQLLLRTLGASEANLEKGEMRIEANVSVASGEERLGTKTEVKNLNSFRSVERAIAYEIERQTKAFERGEKLAQETRGWDETKQETFHQRFKEGSADYRYFPEPDLPKLVLEDVPEFACEALTASLPELPSQKRERYARLGIKSDDRAYLAADVARSAFFDAVTKELDGRPKSTVLAANYFISDMAGDPCVASPSSFAALIQMFAANELSSRGAKDVLAIMITKGGEPAVIAKERGLGQIQDRGTLEAAVERVMEEEPGAVKEYRAGKSGTLQYLLGKAMKVTGGAGDPELLREILIKKLG